MFRFRRRRLLRRGVRRRRMPRFGLAGLLLRRILGRR